MKLPDHECGLFLTHNEHKNYYENIINYMNDNAGRIDYKNEESKQKCVNTDSLWVLQWYPDTPIGCLCIGASTLEEVLEFANEEIEECELDNIF